MAKDTEVEIVVTVDDNGSLKKVSQGAKKAGKSIQGVNRGLKGASKQSSNATKNFSKMAQGMNVGIVPAYAILATNLFAVSAAFEFLKRSADFRVLKEGQQAFAAATGIAMGALTRSMIEATDAQITFSDAAQGAAIGKAAGLSTDQLIRLAKAARDTSSVLGRDVTDSFNRLIRGATKAEPELLDELGIILRLEDAKREYAQATGLQAEKLTSFQRTQAVTNDILQQSEEKYGRILKILDPTTSKINKLGVAFDSMLNKVKISIVSVAEPLAGFLSENIVSTTALFAIFASTILKQVVPALQEGGKASQEAFKKEEKLIKRKIRAQNTLITRTIKNINIEKAALVNKFELIQRQFKKDDLQKLSTAKKLGGANFLLGDATDNRKAQAQFGRSLARAEEQARTGRKVTVALFKNMSNQQILDTHIMFKSMESASTSATSKLNANMKLFGAKTKVVFLQIRATASAAFLNIKKAGVFAITALSKTLSILPFIGLGFLAFDFISGFINPITDAQREAQTFIDKIKALNDELAKTARLTREGLFSGFEGASRLGKSIGNISTRELERIIGIADKNINANVKILELQRKAEISRTKTLLRIGAGEASLPSNLLKTVTPSTPLGFEGLIKVAAKDDDKESLKFLKTIRDIAGDPKFGQAAIHLAEVADAFAGGTDLTKGASNIKKGAEILKTVLSPKGKELLDVFTAAQEFGNLVDSATDATKSAGETFRRFVGDFAKGTRFDGAINSIDTSIKAFNAVLAKDPKALDLILGDSKGNKDKAERLDQNELEIKNLKILNAMRDRETEKQIRLFNIKKDQVLANVNLLSVEKNRIRTLDGIEIKENKLLDLALNIRDLEATKGFATAIDSTKIDNNIRALEAEIKLTKVQINAQEIEIKNLEIIRKIKDDDEAKRVKLIQIQESQLLGSINLTNNELKRLAIMNNIENKQREIFDINTSIATLKAQIIISELAGIKGANTQASADIKALEAKLSLLGLQSEELEKQLDLAQRLGTAFANSFEQGIESGLASLIKGTETSFKDALLGVVKSIASSAADILAEELTRKLISGIGAKTAGGSGAGILSTIASFFGFAKGGIIQGGFQSFAKGSPRVTRPTLGLIGEGRFNEAVVPLPDGKSIPISGNIGNTNIIKVDVNIDGSGGSVNTNVEQGEQQMQQLGNMLGIAVQQEIIRQTRTGGLLNRR